MKIFLAAGHGGVDTGATIPGTTERDETVEIVNQARDFLATSIKPLNELIIVPHELRRFDTVKYINKNSAEPTEDICVEVHMNSNSGMPGTGIETYYGFQKLAEVLQKKTVEVTNLRSRGVKEGNKFYFNYATKPGSAILELGFLNNPKDLNIVREFGARALAEGVVSFLDQIPETAPGPQVPERGSKEDYEQFLAQLRQLIAPLLRLLGKEV